MVGNVGVDWKGSPAAVLKLSWVSWTDSIYILLGSCSKRTPKGHEKKAATHWARADIQQTPPGKHEHDCAKDHISGLSDCKKTCFVSAGVRRGLAGEVAFALGFAVELSFVRSTWAPHTLILKNITCKKVSSTPNIRIER